MNKTLPIKLDFVYWQCLKKKSRNPIISNLSDVTIGGGLCNFPLSKAERIVNLAIG